MCGGDNYEQTLYIPIIITHFMGRQAWPVHLTCIPRRGDDSLILSRQDIESLDHVYTVLSTLEWTPW